MGLEQVSCALFTSLLAMCMLMLLFVTSATEIIGPDFTDTVEGGRAEFQCTFTGLDASNHSVAWLHDGVKLEDGKNVQIEFYDSNWMCYEQKFSNDSGLSKLIIHPARSIDLGIYYCQIDQRRSQPVFLHVTPSEPQPSVEVTCFPSGLFVVSHGSRIKVRCWFPNSEHHPVNNLTWNYSTSDVNYWTDSVHHFAEASITALDNITGAIFMCGFGSGESQNYCISGPVVVHHPPYNFCLDGSDSYFTTPLLYDVSFIQRSAYIDHYQWSCYEELSVDNSSSSEGQLILQAELEGHYIICIAIQNHVYVSATIASTKLLETINSDKTTLVSRTFEAVLASQSEKSGLSLQATYDGQMFASTNQPPDVTSLGLSLSNNGRFINSTQHERTGSLLSSTIQIEGTGVLSTSPSRTWLSETALVPQLTMRNHLLLIGFAAFLTLALCIGLCVFWRKRMKGRKKRLDKFRDGMWLPSKRRTMIFPNYETQSVEPEFESTSMQHQEDRPYMDMRETSVEVHQSPDLPQKHVHVPQAEEPGALVKDQATCIVEVHQVGWNSESKLPPKCSQAQGEGNYMDMTQASSKIPSVFTIPQSRKTLFQSNIELSTIDKKIYRGSEKMVCTCVLKRHQSMKGLQQKALERKSSLSCVHRSPGLFLSDETTMEMQFNPLLQAEQNLLATAVHRPEFMRERGDSSASNTYMEMSKVDFSGPSYVNTGRSRPNHAVLAQTESDNVALHCYDDNIEKEQHDAVHNTYMDALSFQTWRNNKSSEC